MLLVSMALRTILRRTSINLRNQIQYLDSQVLTGAFVLEKSPPLHGLPKKYSRAELDLVTEVISDGFPPQSIWSGAKSVRGAIGSARFHVDSKPEVDVSVSQSKYVSSSELELHSQTCSLSNFSIFTSPCCSTQRWSSFAAYKYIVGRSVSTASKESVPDHTKEQRDGQDKSTPIVENFQAPGANERTWVERLLPMTLQPFARLARWDRPIGTWLLAWPCFWSISLAAPSGGFPDLKMMCLFGVGAFLLRGAGCTVNDLLDRDIDGKVERTRQRPLASGTLTTFQGIGFLGCQLLLGLGVLLQLNDFSRILGASSLVLVGTYPLMKRWTYWPQAFLGLTFNWGALLGWAAVHGDLDLSVVIPLYASGVSWTIVYDTIYAHQDKEDDVKVGVMSTALQFGDETRAWLAGFSAACVSGLTLAGVNAHLGWPFYAGLIASAGHLAWQVCTVDINNRVDCNSKFISSKWFGAIVCSAIVAGKLSDVPW